MRTKLILAALLVLWMPAADLMAQDVQTIQGKLRTETSLYARYYHLALASFDPGASGATWTDPDGNTVGGWYLDGAGEELHFGSDMHGDWDGASDVMLEVYFAVSDGTTVNTDTADLQLISYYIGKTETATKTQTDEIATVTDGTQWKVYEAKFTITHNPGGGQDIDAGDKFAFILNFETDTSEVDNIIIISGGVSFFYYTTHVGIEDGDT